MGWAADLQILRYRTTRAELCRGWFGAAPDLAELAEDFGLDAADVELVTDDAVWRLPDA